MSLELFCGALFKHFLFLYPPLCLAPKASPRATLGRSGIGLVLDGALALRLL